jgi:hypothetical protein
MIRMDPRPTFGEVAGALERPGAQLGGVRATPSVPLRRLRRVDAGVGPHRGRIRVRVAGHGAARRNVSLLSSQG